MSVIVGRDVGSYVFDASAQTITISGVDNLTIQDIDLIVNQTDGIIIFNFASQTLKGSLSSGVLTLDYDTTTMSDTDEIQIRLGKNYGIDYNLNANLSLIQNPVPSYRQSVVSLISAAQNLTASLADFGFEIPVIGYKNITIWATIDINDSLDVRLKFLGKHTSSGTEEYPISSNKVTIDTDNTYVSASASRYFELNDDIDQLVKINIELDNSVSYLQVQAYAGTVGATAGQIDALYYTLGY